MLILINKFRGEKKMISLGYLNEIGLTQQNLMVWLHVGLSRTYCRLKTPINLYTIYYN